MIKKTNQIIPSSTVRPQTHLAVLSATEVNELCAAQNHKIYALFRRCALAVLTSGLVSDDARKTLEIHHDFDIQFEQVDRGIVLHLMNAPAAAFVDGEMITGIREHLFSVLRDIIFVSNDIAALEMLETATSGEITEVVFRILRHAQLLESGSQHGLIVCWGGHSINPDEYDYTKEAGYQLGLRGLDVCTGCGPGAMKGPMKGATIAHAKQRVRNGRYVGLTEPGIIAAEAPNAIVNQLCILPDIEKRLEAFARLAHGVIVFPGGAGTAEEILYLLGVLAHPANLDHRFPLILSGPRGSESYFDALDKFVRTTIGDGFAAKYEVIIDDPIALAQAMRESADLVLRYRDEINDAPYFNWSLTIDKRFQQPFQPSHEAMSKLELNRQLPAHELAGNLRRAFSGVVAGNVKEDGIAAVEAHGPFELHADPEIALALDTLLRSFVADGRMRLPGQTYSPCYRIIN
jgi:predicted Rossmann-fold nucleotide-binding protein